MKKEVTMKHKRKGQAAMEFLMTYGWAILAAIIAIGVLAYFGVFSPGRLVSGNAALNPPLNVDESNIVNDGIGGNDGINLIVLQNSGSSISLNSATITLTSGGTATCTDTAFTDPWSSGTTESFAFDCGGAGIFAAGDTVAANIVISYNQTGSTLTQQSTGTVRGVVQ